MTNISTVASYANCNIAVPTPPEAPWQVDILQRVGDPLAEVGRRPVLRG
jgi:hypothetical protein